MIHSYSSESVLVLTSGGQDSTTCLFWALKNFNKVYGISFTYGQKHEIEIKIAQEICKELDVPLKLIDISFMKDLVVSNLFKGEGKIRQNSHPQNKNVPSSFVPYRNLLFLTLASAWASSLGVRHIIIGVCETDYSGYADCRDVFVKSAQSTLCLATDFEKSQIVIHTPLMWLTKAQEFHMAQELGCLDFILTRTLTCYNGDMTMNDYGYGCGKCPACQLRNKGFQEFEEKYIK